MVERLGADPLPVTYFHRIRGGSGINATDIYRTQLVFCAALIELSLISEAMREQQGCLDAEFFSQTSLG
jgi:hypothetical protein